MSNPLDHKPFKNDLAGKSVKKKQRFKPNPLSGFGKGTDVTVPKNKLAYPPGRHRLVFRSMLDGVKLIESLKDEVEGVSTMPPVKMSKGEQTPSVRPPMKLPKKVTVMADNSSQLVGDLLDVIPKLGITLVDNTERGRYELSKDGKRGNVWWHGENSGYVSNGLLRAIRRLGFTTKQIGHGWEYEITQVV
jgi:hypothetical protein